jgi:hypothetical protein
MCTLILNQPEMGQASTPVFTPAMAPLKGEIFCTFTKKLLTPHPTDKTQHAFLCEGKLTYDKNLNLVAGGFGICLLLEGVRDPRPKSSRGLVPLAMHTFAQCLPAADGIGSSWFARVYVSDAVFRQYSRFHLLMTAHAVSVVKRVSQEVSGAASVEIDAIEEKPLKKVRFISPGPNSNVTLQANVTGQVDPDVIELTMRMNNGPSVRVPSWSPGYQHFNFPLASTRLLPGLHTIVAYARTIFGIWSSEVSFTVVANTQPPPPPALTPLPPLFPAPAPTLIVTRDPTNGGTTPLSREVSFEVTIQTEGSPDPNQTYTIEMVVTGEQFEFPIKQSIMVSGRLLRGTFDLNTTRLPPGPCTVTFLARNLLEIALKPVILETSIAN